MKGVPLSTQNVAHFLLFQKKIYIYPGLDCTGVDFIWRFWIPLYFLFCTVGCLIILIVVGSITNWLWPINGTSSVVTCLPFYGWLHSLATILLLCGLPEISKNGWLRSSILIMSPNNKRRFAISYYLGHSVILLPSLSFKFFFLFWSMKLIFLPILVRFISRKAVLRSACICL